jgi:hypothetical protein
MERASHGTYVSSKVVKAYAKKKQERLEKKK